MITRAVVSLNKASNLPEDAAVNVWHFDHLSVLDASHVQKLLLGLVNFYNSLALYYSTSVLRSGNRIQLATLTPGGAGPEDDTVSVNNTDVLFDMPAGFPSGTTVMPSEVAVCLSLEGLVFGVPEESGSIRPAARRRGRLYLGPLFGGATVAVPESVTNRPRVSDVFQDAILDAYEVLCAYINSTTGPQGNVDSLRSVVYSPTTAQAWPVYNAWVDDAFDTIRSRGEKSVLRTTRVISQPTNVLP